LTGKVKRGHPAPAGSRLSELKIKVDDETFQRLLELENWATSNGRSLLEVAFGALVGRPVVGSVIAGATSAAQVAANVEAASWRPSEGELIAIDAIAPQPQPLSY
jgi:aryl-alcohol dehydrogenase-like predicted oxidoreductase